MDKKIKFYGLINITKKQYLRGEFISIVLLIILWIWAIAGDFNKFFFGHGTLILIATTLAEIVEVCVTLRTFRNS